jgi:carbamoyltransferase
VNGYHFLNDRIKHREYFRPFAASVLEERSEEWFEFGRHSMSDAFMLYARKVRRNKLGKIPAVTHADDTCRVQCIDRGTNPRFYRLIEEFESITGVPLVLNTSFNDREPIICSPEDAIHTCLNVGIRFLAIGDYLIDFQEENAVDFDGQQDIASDLLVATQAAYASNAMMNLKQPVSLAFRSR